MNKVVLMIVLSTFALNSYCATEPYTAKIKHLRVESTYAFITMEGVLPWAESLNCDDTRVWLDLRDEIDRIKYSSALAAMMAGKKVYIRAVDAPNNLVFGACKLNDIIVYAE